jgi:HSP20 family protein
MGENITKLPVSREGASEPALQIWQPFESFRRELDRLFDDFGRSYWQPSRPSFLASPLFGREITWSTVPAVDVAESEKAYEITAETPGMAEKTIEVKITRGNLTIKGQKQEEIEEKKKDYYLQERKFGSFERSFSIPEGVDTDKIEAAFKNGVLRVTLPKKLEAQKAAKNIEVKAA